MRMKAKVMDQRTKIIFAKVNLVGTPTANVIINQNEVLAGHTRQQMEQRTQISQETI